MLPISRLISKLRTVPRLANRLPHKGMQVSDWVSQKCKLCHMLKKRYKEKLCRIAEQRHMSDSCGSRCFKKYHCQDYKWNVCTHSNHCPNYDKHKKKQEGNSTSNCGDKQFKPCPTHGLKSNLTFEECYKNPKNQVLLYGLAHKMVTWLVFLFDSFLSHD